MLNKSGPSVEVEYTAEFKRDLRALAKKYRHIRLDVKPMIDRMLSGEVPGDQISGTRYTLFKVRVENSDIPKGKRSGYRIVYCLKNPASILLVTLYSKLDQFDISPEQVRRILREFDREK